MPNVTNRNLPPGMPKRVLEAGTGRPVQVSRYLAEFQGEPEIVKWGLYDYLTYAAAGATRFAFFATAGANLRASNMQGNGQLPAPQILVVESIQVPWLPDPTVTVAQNVDVLQAGALEFTVSHKPYHQGAPIAMYPAGFGPVGVMTDTAAHIVSNGWATSDAVYKLKPYAVAIPPNRFFTVEITFDVAIPVAADSRIGVVLSGYLIRPIQ